MSRRAYVDFDLSQYVARHGYVPRGQGRWAFKCDSPGPSFLLNRNYSEAREIVRASVLRDLPEDFRGRIRVKVMP